MTQYHMQDDLLSKIVRGKLTIINQDHQIQQCF